MTPFDFVIFAVLILFLGFFAFSFLFLRKAFDRFETLFAEAFRRFDSHTSFEGFDAPSPRKTI